MTACLSGYTACGVLELINLLLLSCTLKAGEGITQQAGIVELAQQPR